jgi:hypothetical protein
MKTYRLLNDGETILDTDLCYGFDRKWITPQDTIGMPFNSEWIFPIKREVPPPQWQTGPIPSPTGPSVIYFERIGQPPEGHLSFEVRNRYGTAYGWQGVDGTRLTTYFAKLQKLNRFTGRWYMQAITLPS